MFIRRSTYEAMAAEVERLAAERDQALAENAACRSTTVDTCRRYADADSALTRARFARLKDAALYRRRITRLVRACGRYRAEMARLERSVTRLQARLDDATGLLSPAVDAGAAWQQRRQDKDRTAVKP
ncbi:hypothetical protein [Streptomyces lavendulocolor]|uniref:hypothetical protein n=1 Tax=Streptomyces lavendulocolor TaxID=67316 RepID=UPI003C2C9D37